uniref:Uncharacterized protein n=1 Tax=Oncorhynchus mykiss TaxID=8022 RepID=A0A8C7VRS4_ONCMY
FQQTQIEKHRALAEESNRKGDGLQQQVTALQKRAQKQAATNHSAIKVRLNRGSSIIIDISPYPTDIFFLLLEQMHLEAAKMLSFTEEGFMKALDWGKS